MAKKIKINVDPSDFKTLAENQGIETAGKTTEEIVKALSKAAKAKKIEQKRRALETLFHLKSINGDFDSINVEKSVLIQVSNV